MADLRRHAARLLRGLGVLRPVVSVLVDVTADSALVDASLDSARAQPLSGLEIVVVGPAADERVARHLAEDWRVRRGDGRRAARGRYVLWLQPGDRLADGAIEALLAGIDSSGAAVALGRTASDVPASGHPQTSPTPLRAAPQLVWPLRSARMLFRREALDRSVPLSDPAGLVGALLAAPSVVEVPVVTLLPPAPSDARFGVVDDPVPDLSGWLDSSRAAAVALTDPGLADVLRAWRVGWLGGAAPRFLDAAERLDDASWQALRAAAGEAVDALGDGLARVPVEARVKAWLAARDHREDLERLVVARRFEHGQYPTEVRDGQVYAVLPVEIPADLLRLEEPETPMVASVRWAGPEVVALWAYVAGVHLAETPSVSVRLDGKELTVTSDPDVEVTVAVGSRFHDHARGSFRVAVPAQPLQHGRLDVTLETAGVRRSGMVAMPARPTLTDPAEGLVLDEVRQPGDDLVLAGRWLGRGISPAPVELRSPGCVLTGELHENGPTVQTRLALRADPWGRGSLPAPSGRYRLDASPSVELAGRLPLVLHGEHHRALVRLDAGRLELTLGPALRDDERGPYAQARLQEGYARRRDLLDPELAYFQSYDGRAATDSPVAVHAELRRRRPGLRCVWAVRDRAAWIPDGAEPVLWGSREWYDVLARAAYLVTNIEMERWFRRREGQQLVQTFHGYPSKTMGIGLWRSKGFTDSRIAQQLERTSAQWSLLVTPSPEMDDYYRVHYAYDGRVVAAGYPRDDVLVSPEAERLRADSRARLGIAEAQTAVLYAPTWRDDLATNYRAAQAGDLFDVDAAAARLGGGFVLLLRGHRFHPRHTDRARRGEARLVDVTDHPEINDLILASDAAVLDYSSLRFDYALTGRPMIFLVPDVQTYTSRTRGFLFDFAPTAPGPWVGDTAGVVSALRDLPTTASAHEAAYQAFNARFNALHDGHAAERVVDALLG